MKPLRECTLPDTTTTLNRLWEVVSNKHSEEQFERQKILLETYLSVTGNSVKIADLHLLTRIMSFLRSRSEIDHRYQTSFDKVINLLKKPAKMEKSSDQLNHNLYISNLFTTLGCILLETNSNSLKSEILHAAEGILFTERPKDVVPGKICLQALEASKFVDCLTDFMAITETSLYYQTIYTALQICLVSNISCWNFLQKEIIETLLVRLTMHLDENGSEILEVTYQLLWRLFTCTNNKDDWLKVTTPSRIALRGLRYVLREQSLTHHLKLGNDSNLNNIAGLLLKIMHIFPKADYELSGLIEDITFFATLSEAVLGYHMLPYFKNELDNFQFKKLMLACLALSPITNFSVSTFKQFNVAECLVIMLEGGHTSSYSVSWCKENANDLTKCVLPVISALFNCLQKRFINAGLLKQLVTLINMHCDLADKSQFNVIHLVLKTLFFICFSKKSPNLTRKALKNVLAIEVLMRLCGTLLKTESSLTICVQSMLWHSICVLTALLSEDKELQNKHYESTSCVVSQLYKRILVPLPRDSLIDNRLIVSVSNFAWEVLVQNKENAVKFISSGEIFQHIDILVKSSFSVQLVSLSMLVDICEYHQCIPYLVTWRGNEGVKFLSVLCRIWRTEEERIKVPRSKNHCIVDIERSLMGDNQFKLSKEEAANLTSVYDVFGSARPKIYAISQLLARHKEVVEICEDHYRLGHAKIPPEDQITMRLIEAFLPLKMGEIWWEIRQTQQINPQNVLPLDRYLADTLTDRYLNWSLSVQQAQYDVLIEQNMKLRDEEQQLYCILRSDQLTSALEALREVAAIARAADRQIMQRCDQKLQQGIDASRAPVDIPFRVAFPPDTSISVLISQRSVTLQNESDSSSVTSRQK